MRNTVRRAYVVYLLVAAFFAGLVFMVYSYAYHGKTWVTNRVNSHLYTNRQLTQAGTVYDRNGEMLVTTKDGKRIYNDSSTVRKAVLHCVGDTEGYISTGVQTVYRSYLIGYDFVSGVYNTVKNKAGNDITLTIDAQVCKTAYEALGSKKGSVGVYNYKTGEVICMVSTPTFDPVYKPSASELETNEKYEGVYINRFLSGVFTPGSTFKTAQALKMLQEGIIQATTPAFPCAHGFNYRSLRVGCHGHASPLPLIPAIATSCNSYFCWGLFRMFSDKKYGSPQNAITVWKDHMVSQGFGYKLGTDLPSEQRGFIPNSKTYDRAYRGSWNGLTVISISIGQGEILATPLQIANLGATIANRGHFITPHIVREIEDNELDSPYRTPRYTTIDRSHYEEVVKGMRAAVTGSTGSATCRMVSTILPGVEACGKTGTAQNKGKDHSVFMGFAPMDNPKIAIAVYVENGGFGATYGVPIGAMMMDQYLHGKLSPENELRAEEFSNRVIYYSDEER